MRSSLATLLAATLVASVVSGLLACGSSSAGTGPSSDGGGSDGTSTGDGPGGNGGDSGDGGGNPSDGGAACPSPVPADPLASQRAACSFGGGAKVEDTLGLTAAQRSAIPIKNVIVMMKENRSFD
ncbi:MAG TPA: hypothetical protein VIF09_21525, partial [Polyangiaceae bacterium]